MISKLSKKTTHSTDQTIKKLIKAIIGAMVDLWSYQVFLFGSRAQGSHTDRSDYDIGILWPKSIPYPDLFMIARLVNALPVKVEVVDFMRVSDEFKEYAMRKIILL